MRRPFWELIWERSAGRLSNFGDEWQSLEEDAAPQFPWDQINETQAECSRVQGEAQERSAQSAAKQQESSSRLAELPGLDREIVDLETQQRRAWDEYQRLSTLLNQAKEKRRSAEEDGRRAATEASSLQTEATALFGRFSELSAILDRLRANPVVNPAAQRAADQAASLAISLKEEALGFFRAESLSSHFVSAFLTILYSF